MRDVAVSLRGVVKRYGDVRAADDITFDVQRGEIFGLLGPNAAGKTTTLEIAEGLRQPDAGEALLLGEPVWPRNAELLPRLGVQLQTSAFFDRLTAREQLRAFASLYAAPFGRVDTTLALVGLTDSSDVQVEKMSGGQVQRLAIACALVHDPEVVFLDEPSAGLDPQAREHLWQVILEIRAGGQTVVLTTHYMDEAEILCDRVAVMDGGRILALDAPARLVRSLDVPVRVTVPVDALAFEEALRITGVERVEADGVLTTMTTRCRERVLRALDARRLLDAAEVQGATLQDVFLDLTGTNHPA